ncbi:hypothetical protein SDC9_81298 [bioreactor metagenome]|uniref:Uncharacterized protein n=1 Tax=bioreactor metagenome TaxID=1076179 RepID=A0A644Z3Z4_9ZZZZ
MGRLSRTLQSGSAAPSIGTVVAMVRRGSVSSCCTYSSPRLHLLPFSESRRPSSICVSTTQPFGQTMQVNVRSLLIPHSPRLPAASRFYLPVRKTESSPPESPWAVKRSLQRFPPAAVRFCTYRSARAREATFEIPLFR